MVEQARNQAKKSLGMKLVKQPVFLLITDEVIQLHEGGLHEGKFNHTWVGWRAGCIRASLFTRR